jgi:hypothetical protein
MSVTLTQSLSTSALSFRILQSFWYFRLGPPHFGGGGLNAAHLKQKFEKFEILRQKSEI